MGKVLDDTNLGYFISKIKAAFWPKTDVVQIDIDNTPTVNSENLVKSGGVYTALSEKMEQYVIPIYQDSETNDYYVDSSVTYTTINTAISNEKLIYIGVNDKNGIIPATYNIDNGVIQIAGLYGVLGAFVFVSITTSANDAPSVIVGSASIPSSLADLTDDSTHRIVTDTEKSTWNGKQDTISDLATIRSNAAAGASKVSNVQSDWNATSGLAQILNKPTIPTDSALVHKTGEEHISGLKYFGTDVHLEGNNNILAHDARSGFGWIEDMGGYNLQDKLDEKYSKPSTGIPATDLASAVQTSLGKADTALQSYTETDPVFTASAAHGISSTDISNWNAKQKAITISSSEPTSSQGSNGDIWIVV